MRGRKKDKKWVFGQEFALDKIVFTVIHIIITSQCDDYVSCIFFLETIKSGEGMVTVFIDRHNG